MTRADVTLFLHAWSRKPCFIAWPVRAPEVSQSCVQAGQRLQDLIRSALQTPSRPLSHCSPESSKSNARRCAEWPAISFDRGCKEVVFQPWPRRRANNELTSGAVTGRESGSGRLRCAERPAISSGCAAMASPAAPKASHFSSPLSCAERPAPATAAHAFDCSTMGLGSGFAGFTSSVGRLAADWAHVRSL